MKKLLTFTVVLLLSLSVLAQSKKEAAVWAKAEALSKAIFETKDKAALESLISTGVTYGHSGGNLEDKQTMISNAVANKEVYNNPTVEKISVDVDGKTAVVRHLFRATAVKDGIANPLNLGLLQVWKKEGGQWRLWARQAVKVPAQQ